jgi:hypothetical protein
MPSNDRRGFLSITEMTGRGVVPDRGRGLSSLLFLP